MTRSVANYSFNLIHLMHEIQTRTQFGTFIVPIVGVHVRGLLGRRRTLLACRHCSLSACLLEVVVADLLVHHPHLQLHISYRPTLAQYKARTLAQYRAPSHVSGHLAGGLEACVLGRVVALGRGYLGNTPAHVT